MLTVQEWMLPRWTEVAVWEPAEWDAFANDLRGWKAGQVLTALYWLWKNGREKAPKAGVILAMLRDLDIHPAVPDAPALPQPATITLEEFADVRFGGWAQMWQRIREGIR